MKASVEAFTAFMEASVEDMKYMKVSTEITSTGASTKASAKASMKVISTKTSMEALWK